MIDFLSWNTLIKLNYMYIFLSVYIPPSWATGFSMLLAHQARD